MSQLAKPLYELTSNLSSKLVHFDLTEEQKQAVETLKTAIMTSSCLALQERLLSVLS